MSDERLRRRVAEAMRGDPEVPDFDTAWRAAEARYRKRPARIRLAAGAAAAIAAVAVALMLDTPSGDAPMVVTDDLLGSTSWQAPSDVLLPRYQTDIYQDLPDLIESGGSAVEAFL